MQKKIESFYILLTYKVNFIYEKICVGIIGVGRIGKIHLNNLSNHLKSIEIGAISDIDEKKRKTL